MTTKSTAFIPASFIFVLICRTASEENARQWRSDRASGLESSWSDVQMAATGKPGWTEGALPALATAERSGRALKVAETSALRTETTFSSASIQPTSVTVEGDSPTTTTSGTEKDSDTRIDASSLEYPLEEDDGLNERPPIDVADTRSCSRRSKPGSDWSTLNSSDILDLMRTVISARRNDEETFALQRACAEIKCFAERQKASTTVVASSGVSRRYSPTPFIQRHLCCLASLCSVLGSHTSATGGSSPSRGSCSADRLRVTLSALVRELNWPIAVLFYDRASKKLVSEIQQSLPEVLFLLNYLDGNESSSTTRTMILESYTRWRRHGFGYLLLCSEIPMASVLHQANNLDAATNVTLMRHFSRWIVYSSTPGVETVRREASKLDHVAIITNRWSESGGNCKLQEKDEEIRVDGGRLLTLTWTENGRFLHDLGDLGNRDVTALADAMFPNVHFGLNRKHFVVTTRVISPFVSKSNISGTLVYRGYCVDIFEHLAKSLNFTYTLTEPADNDFGILINGSWTGMIGQLERKEADIALQILTVEAGRDAVVDFTYPFCFDKSVGVFKKPESKTKWRSLADHFTWPILLVMGAALIVAIAVLFFMEKKLLIYCADQQSRGRNKVSFGEIAWHLCGSYFIQGGAFSPQTDPGKLLLFFWWWTVIILMASINADLFTSLVTTEPVPFDNFEDLLSQDEYTFGMYGYGIRVNTFKNSREGSLYRRLWEAMLRYSQDDPDVLATSGKTLFEKVRKEKFLFILSYMVSLILNTDICGLARIDEPLWREDYALALQQHSPYIDVFSKRILEFHESGTLERLKKKHFQEIRCADEKEQSKSTGVKLMQLLTTFYVLAGGFGLAVFVLAIEKAWQRLAWTEKERSVKEKR